MASRNYVDLTLYKTILETIDSLEGSVCAAENEYETAKKAYSDASGKFSGTNLIIKAVLFGLAGICLFYLLSVLFNKSFLLALLGIPAGAAALYIYKMNYDKKNKSRISGLKKDAERTKQKYEELCANVTDNFALLSAVLYKTTGIKDVDFSGDNSYGNLACINYILNSDVKRPGQINFTAAYNRFLLVRSSLNNNCDTEELKQLKEQIDKEQERQLSRLEFIEHCQQQLSEFTKGE